MRTRTKAEEIEGQCDTAGKKFDLNSVKARYILLDFWASDCSPCRHTSPFLVEAYKEFHSKGLEIVSISLDSDEQSWKSAIEEDSLTWINVTDFNDWNNTVALKYFIDGIPLLVIIDSNYKVIFYDPQPADLKRWLGELFLKNKG